MDHGSSLKAAGGRGGAAVLSVLAALTFWGPASAQPDPAAPAPGVDTRAVNRPAVERDADGAYILRNRHLVAVLHRSPSGYGPLTLYPATRPATESAPPIAVIPALLSAASADGDPLGEIPVFPREARVMGRGQLRLTGAAPSGAAVSEVTIDLRLDNEPWLQWEAAAVTTASRVTAFPVHLPVPGEREALLPGVAYLEANEAPAETPIRPRPNHVTIPYMAVAHAGKTLAVLWAPPAAGEARLSPLLDAPVGRTHRLELSAAPPAAGGPVTLRGRVLVLGDDPNVTEVVRHWARAYRLPEGRPPRTAAAARALARQAYAAAGAGTSAEPAFDTLTHLIEGRLTRDQTLLAQAHGALLTHSSQDLRLAYRTGRVREALAAERLRIDSLIRAQLATGGWSLAPEQQPNSGNDVGATEPGIIALHALPILRYAAVTGDTEAAGAGLRAAQLLERAFRIPRGGLPGQLSVAAPDLLAAAQTAELFLWTYLISGERRFLEQARYWADTGLPFIYLWGGPDRSYVSVPFFGPGGVEHEGRGQGEQWAGLEFARVLQMLLEQERDPLYEQVAGGIVRAAILQQATEGPQAGRYPERWDPATGTPSGAWLNPDLLLQNLYPALGVPADVSNVRIRRAFDRMIVSSGAAIQFVDARPLELRAGLRWLPGEEAITTIVGVPSRPLSVEYNSPRFRTPGIDIGRRHLPEVETSQEVGWQYLPEAQMLLLRLPHGGGTDRLEIRWDTPRARFPIDEVPSPGNPRQR
jgi:hypothetical protein